ncbi:hypothetical protein Nepgr_027459 [Nepenthes gracilis]|uniref:Uncharacterized protein n=1 Tax=Nepenthes gracilis TaxID=150966 RepID=A0AAD3TAJ7_NEPGR|nr:hypothetical protein Nepgr_027459 [Nepenthes gracilis]
MQVHENIDLYAFIVLEYGSVWAPMMGRLDRKRMVDGCLTVFEVINQVLALGFKSGIAGNAQEQ